MCRNITMLRGLDPPATDDEIRAAALQYVRKVGSLSSIGPAAEDAVERAVAAVASATAVLLAELPARRVPPAVLPPLRRRSGRS